MSERSPHHRAVSLFSDLVDAPIEGLCQKPADLVRALNRASATAYRGVGEAEAAGLVQRDMHQSYRRGLIARRIGFSAFGFGDLADIAEPLVVDLREKVRLTALCGFLKGGQLHVGPYSLGRGAGYVRPARTYTPDDICADASVIVTRVRPERDNTPSPYLRFVVMRKAADAMCILGVISTREIGERAEGVDIILKQYPSMVVEGQEATS